MPRYDLLLKGGTINRIGKRRICFYPFKRRFRILFKP